MEKQRAAIKFKAAARIARVTHDLTNMVRVDANAVSKEVEEQDENES